MLPPGLTAHAADRAAHLRLIGLHPGARTVVELLVGACSCDLIRPRQVDQRADERRHREWSRRHGIPRTALLDGLERHRRGARGPVPPGGWPAALAAFVAEHARNAGDSLYLLSFTLAPLQKTGPTRAMTAAEVVARPDAWLVEGTPTLVAR